MASDQGPTKKPGEETASLAWSPNRDATPIRIPGGTVVAGRYRVVRCIGAGGMGEVYEVEDLQLERIVALKVVGPIGVDAEAALSEARKAARLRHPFIATVFDAGIEQIRGVRSAYLAMELVPGAERIDAWAHRANADAARTLTALAQVCDAMAHAHGRGVVHGDLKPTNILMDADGNPRVIDFGVSRALGVDESLQANRGGTPGYSAPEQEHRNAPALDGRVDVFALGVIARELVGPRTTSEAASRDLETLVREATHHDRAARVATVDELGENLRALAEDRELPLAHRDAAYVLRHRVRRMARRAPWAWAIVAAALGAAAAVLIGVPLMHRWTPIDRWVTAALDAVPRFGGARLPWQDVRVVVLSDDDDLESLAAREGIEGVLANERITWRALHGRLMERLASAGVRVVAWDIRFGAPSPLDAHLVKGIEAVRAAGGDVVLGARDWKVDEAGLPEVSANLLPHAPWGTFTGAVDTDPWRVDLVLARGEFGEAMPSLALRALGAAWFPGAEMDAWLDADSGVVKLRFWKPVAGIARARTWVGDEKRLRVSAVAVTEADNPGWGFVRGDRVGVQFVDVPPDQTLDTVTIGFSNALTMPAPELRERVGGAVVFVASRRNGEDLHPHPSGRMLPGVWMQACACEALRRNMVVALPTPRTDVGLAAGFALFGGLAGMSGKGRTRDRLVFLACLATCCVLVFVALYSFGGMLVNTAVQGFGAIVAWELAAIGSRVRRGSPAARMQGA